MLKPLGGSTRDCDGPSDVSVSNWGIESRDVSVLVMLSLHFIFCTFYFCFFKKIWRDRNHVLSQISESFHSLNNPLSLFVGFLLNKESLSPCSQSSSTNKSKISTDQRTQEF